MGWFEGMLGGFHTRKQEVEQENLRQAEAAADREGRVFQALLSSPDPEIQSLAATGLLESARPRKRAGGLKGWIGELEQSPILSQIQGLIQTPVQKTEGTLPQLGSTQYGGTGAPPTQIATRPPTEAPAGMAAESLTQPGAAPAVTPLPAQAPRQIPAQVGTPPTFGPREVFASPETTARLTARAKAQGDVEGDVEGLVASGVPRPEAIEIIKQERLRAARGATGTQSIAGEIVGPDGRAVPAFGVFNRASGQYVDPNTGQPMQNFRPRTTTGSTSMGADREAVSRELFGRPYAQLDQTQQAQVNQTLPQRAGTLAEARGLGTGRASIATQLATPIGPTAARQYNVSPTMTLGELQNTVGIDDTQKDRVYALGQIDAALDDIEAGIPKVFPNVPEGFTGALKTALSLGTQRLAGDGDLAALDAAIEGSLAQIAQLSGQPGSRLSDNDIKMARAELVNLRPSLFGGDTINTARARLSVVRRLFEKAQQSIPTSPQVGAAPPTSSRPGGPPTRERAGTPPPGPAQQSGPAGVFVDAQGNLVYR